MISRPQGLMGGKEFSIKGITKVLKKGPKGEVKS